MLAAIRWGERRRITTLATMILAMTATLSLYCWLSPYPSVHERMSMMTGVERKLFAKHAINNTVVIVPVNTGMINLVDNMLCSLTTTSFDIHKIIFWALDDGAEEVFDNRGFATFRESTLFGVSGDQNHKGDTGDYRRMMKERPKFFSDLLATGYDMLMIDADIVFWQSPELLIPDRDTVDIVYSTDSREFYQVKNAFKDVWRRGELMPPVCNGLFWMKGSEGTVKLWQDMLRVFEAGWRTKIFQLTRFQDDQRGADYLLNDGRATLVAPYPDGIIEAMVPRGKVDENTLRVQLLDQTQVVNGHLLKNRRKKYDQNLKKLEDEGKHRIAVHFNWATREMTKQDGAREFGMYYLDRDGNCKLP